jgi:Mg/Co/Ni transporter MgtE
MEEAILRRFWHRLPWLLLGLVGALMAADIVGWFEVQLQNNVLLAFFVAGVDPALGSGPLATVIQDLLSILMYFAIATSMVR